MHGDRQRVRAAAKVGTYAVAALALIGGGAAFSYHYDVTMGVERRDVADALGDAAYAPSYQVEPGEQLVMVYVGYAAERGLCSKAEGVALEWSTFPVGVVLRFALTPSGVEVESFERRGQRPGEFTMPPRLIDRSSGSFYLFDGASQRFTLLGPEPEPISSFRTRSAPFSAVALQDGRLVHVNARTPESIGFPLDWMALFVRIRTLPTCRMPSAGANGR